MTVKKTVKRPIQLSEELTNSLLVLPVNSGVQILQYSNTHSGTRYKLGLLGFVLCKSTQHVQRMQILQFES